MRPSGASMALPALPKWLPSRLALAPMAGVSTPRLVVACCRAGLLGLHGGAFRSARELAADADEVAAGAGAGAQWGVNLFCYPAAGEREVRARWPAARARLEYFYSSLGLGPVPGPEELLAGVPNSEEWLAQQLDVLAAKRVPVVSFTFGCPSAEQVRRLHEAGCAVLGTATSVAEALALERAGVDAVVAQGADAGGHRASWLPGASLVGTFSLVPQVASAVRIPVLAAGGIMDGRGVAAALCLGSTAAALGTAFIAAAESQAPRIYKDALLAAGESETIVTDVFTGRSARGLANRFAIEYDPHGPAANHNRHRITQQQSNVLPYPYQQFLTNRIKKAASDSGDKQLIAMWCGQGVGLASQRTVAEIVHDINEHLQALGIASDLPARSAVQRTAHSG